MLSTPVVLIAFNRPHLTSRTFAAIREARPSDLFLVVDGPRADRPDDAGLCAETRAVLDGVDWPCRVHRRYAESNVGLEANVELGLDWVFGQVDRAIVLEDDCVAHPSFFRYAAELLDRYADDQRVWQVSGSGLGVPRELFSGHSYAFTAWASVWGWATWADRWQQHRAVFVRDHTAGQAPVRTETWTARPGQLVTRSGLHHFTEASQSPDTITHGWDKHWWLTMISRGAFALSPAANLVENVGWGAGATHASHVVGRSDHAAVGLDFPLQHPARVALDVEVERELELVLSRVGGRSARLARKVLRSPRLRNLARKAVNSRAAVRAARTASRLTDRSPRG
ncbi:hypothetical protein [Nocardioides sp.]|uniref:hypothetical protein n=1 Tax=Nocardioides sp. TaxID=35761 RepID=UPI002C376AB0|nr:hypothetical protein [Nocardioides sp.]HSX66829.1 hypothetical protein [Nocardioides sp.]